MVERVYNSKALMPITDKANKASNLAYETSHTIDQHDYEDHGEARAAHHKAYEAHAGVVMHLLGLLAQHRMARDVHSRKRDFHHTVQNELMAKEQAKPDFEASSALLAEFASQPVRKTSKYRAKDLGIGLY